MLKVAVLSYWHVHAEDYSKDAERHPDTKITAVWDEIPERGMEKAAKRGVPFYENLDELLSLPNLSGVIVVTPTNMHRDVMVAAAKAGKHIFSEKVLASTTKECQEIIDSVNDAGVKLTVSLPRLNEPYTLAIRSLLESNGLGRITQVRTRLSHNGATAGWLPEHFYNAEQSGGGALIDLGCHPVYLTRLFLGQSPEQVSAVFGSITGKEVEDHAVVLLKCKDGAIGIAETGFVNAHSPFSIEVHGTEGSVLYSDLDRKLWMRSNLKPEMKDRWAEIEMPPARESAFEQWVSHIQNDSTADENIRIAVELTRLMEASYISATEKRSVFLDEQMNGGSVR